jgi:putative CocE/NonD family hydrolase
MKPIKLSYLVSVIIFAAVGCENKLNKLPEPTKPTESAEQTQPSNETALAGAEAEELGVIIERNVPVPMRDGTILRADVHRPDRGGPYPVLVQRTPYGKDGSFDRFVKAGYIVVSQDTRGRYKSEGKFESNWRLETHDAEDGYDTVEWAAWLPGSNGKVGTFGTSYPAFMQWRLAYLQPPSLVAMSACSIPAQMWHVEGPGTVRPAFRLEWLLAMAFDMRRHENIPGIHTRWEELRLWQEEQEKWLYWLPWSDLPQDFFGYETDILKAWLKNPHVEPWRLDEGCREILVPNLDIVGWYDHCNGDMLLFRTMIKEAKTEVARKGSRIIIGPWSHSLGRSYPVGGIDFGLDATVDIISARVRWFDYWLKGKQNGVDKDAPVRIFVMGDNQWRSEQHWPLQRSKERVLYITSDGHANSPSGDGSLIVEKAKSPCIDNYVYNSRNPVPTPYGAKRTIPSDQRSLGSRQDILVYQTAPLNERIEVTGNPVVQLYAASSALDTDWFVRLIDVYPNGLALDISHGFVRARYRNGLDKPGLIEPGKVYKYTIRMRPTSNAFLPGHRIRLDITSSDFPQYDRNHNTAADQNADATLLTANQIIYHGGDQATRIILPWVSNPTVKEEPTEEEKPAEEKREPVTEKQIYPFHQAAADGDIERVKLLLSKGADINTKDEKENTPLHYAAETGKKGLVKLLVEAGADVNAGTLTPLSAAVGNDHTAVAEYLIERGADVNTPEGWTPLQGVPYTSSIEMAELLIAKGADINAGPWTALQGAMDEGRWEIAKLLIAKGADVNVGPYTALQAAVDEGRRDIVKLLIEEGADVNVKDSWGKTPLDYAFSSDREDITILIFERTADFTSKAKNDLTILNYAAVNGFQELAKLCLAKGAKVDERDEVYEFTALHYAARFGSKNVAEVLIANGADINAKDKWDYQPIHWAAYHDRPDVVELLIDNCADVNAETSLGQTPLELAKPRRNTKTIKLLQKYGAKE